MTVHRYQPSTTLLNAVALACADGVGDSPRFCRDFVAFLGSEQEGAT